MEYIWCFIAALLAGVGTGLAGLSAATVMVPIMIVLCPSFVGETGAYHATAVALASDILGSAFTAGIYIKHKNIDLKRGGLMMSCIIAMCIVGSFAAYLASNVVLGSLSLFLCVGIGIRFLAKPDTQRKDISEKGDKLDPKGIVISLFFGLTIGFGTGFVGSGGGMMMLVVFTAFLGMDRRTAVGTSTFIMTFTALIAFVSHSLIDPTIILDDLPILLLCMVTETAASILSARFANRVNNRTVGLVTGAVLVVLGIVMLGINYREPLAALSGSRNGEHLFADVTVQD
ncbi:MAG: sulfite exporter TauE/SafE family protein [Oscillospiraceae bacterium]